MALTTFWQQQLVLFQQQAQNLEKNDLPAAQLALRQASQQLDIDLKALDQITGEIAKKRAQLAVTALPADANALVAEITLAIIQQRGLQGQVLDDRDGFDAAQAGLDAANASLNRVRARIASLQALIAQAAPADAQRDALRQAAQSAPLDTLKTAADTLFNSLTVTKNAPAGLDKEFPPEIVDLAKLRYQTRADRLAGLRDTLDLAEDALAAGLAADGGLQGVVEEKRIAFQRAQRLLAEYAATAADRFNRAQATLAVLEAIGLDASGTVPGILTDAEKQQLLPPSLLATDGAAAAGSVAALDTDFKAIHTALDGLDAEILSQIGTDVDKLNSDPTVLAAKRTAVADAIKTYQDAVSAFAVADKADLDQWQAVIPDAAWKVLLDYHEGLAALAELKGIEAKDLADAMDKAEQDYTDALADAELARRKADALNDAIALRTQVLVQAQAASTARLPSAVRGDSY